MSRIRVGDYSVPPQSGYYSSRIITQNTGGIRSRSMEDHRHLPLSVADRAIYRPKKEYYTGELFGDDTQQNEIKFGSVGDRYYRSSSAERIGGITVVPIRREATLPARRFHSELRAELKREGIDDNYGNVGKQKTFGENFNYDRYSTFDKRQQNYERPLTTFDIWRDKYKNEAIQEPKTLATSYTINYPNGTTTAAEYSTFQQNADGEGGTALKHFQHTKHQQNQREYKEWHSGDKQQRRSAADSYTTMGTLRNSAEERQARKAIQYHQKQEKQHRERGDGDHHFHRQHYEHYTNGWVGNGVGANYQNKKPTPRQQRSTISQQPSPIPLEHRPFYSYNNSLPPPGHQQIDIPVYRDRVIAKENGRPLAASHSESSFGHREIPVNREHNYPHRY
uniref:ZM domain-containing protein n=1 Tax=Meloidogyne hapla TaxID=6305 RepID=A0A1I8BYL8_MELHA